MKTLLRALLVVISLASAPASAATLAILNKSDATAILVALPSREVKATLPTGYRPHEGAVSPNGRWLVTANYGTSKEPGNTLTLIDIVDAKVVRTIDLGESKQPHGAEWIDDRHVIATCEASQQIVLVDAEAGTVTHRIATDQEDTHMVVLSPDRTRAYVANIGSGSYSAIDLTAKKKLADVKTGEGAEGIGLSPDGKRLWVANGGASTVTAVDVATGAVAKVLPTGKFPIRAKFTPDGKNVVVVGHEADELRVYDAAKLKELRRVNVGKGAGPIGLVFDGEGKTAYLALTSLDKVAVYDPKTWKKLGEITAGKEPDGMAYSPADVAPKASPAPAVPGAPPTEK